MIKVAIVGLPQSGKSTVFKALTATREDREGDYSHKSEFHIASVKVPDERLTVLTKALSPKKITQTELSFIDEKGFSLKHSKETDALVCVIRDFDNVSVAHPKGNLDIKRDLLDLEAELFINDITIVSNRLEKLEVEFKKGRKEVAPELGLMKKLQGVLEADTPLRKANLDPKEEKLISGFEFLTDKKQLVLLNTDEGKINTPISEEIKRIALEKDFSLMKFSAKIEAELSDLNSSERDEFLKSFNIGEIARDRIIKAVYELLEIITFFTVKSGQLKAWTIKKDTRAREAAGKIHSDIERGFIKAEVINFNDFKECNFDFHLAKEKHLLRLESKDYEVCEGDIIDFRFNK